MPAGPRATYRRAMDTTLPVLAGTVSTAVFVGSELPMLHKARRTRELSSYSFGNIALANLGNAVHSVYVFHLPPGPIWVLHAFYVVSSGLMLYWYVRSRSVLRRSVLGRDDVRVGAGVDQPLVTVAPLHEVGRIAVRASHLDDLPVPGGCVDLVAFGDQAVAHLSLHGIHHAPRHGSRQGTLCPFRMTTDAHRAMISP